MAGEQAGQQCRRVVGASTELEGSFAQRSGAGSLFGDGVLELSRQRRRQLRFQGWAELRREGERNLEIADDLVAPRRKSRSQRGAGDGHECDRAGVAAACGDIARHPQQPLGVEGGAETGEGVGLGQQDLDKLIGLDGRAGVGGGGSKPAQVTSSFGEGERGAIGLSGSEGPACRPVGSVESDRGGEVPGQLAGNGLPAAMHAVLQRFADRSVQGDAPHGIEPGDQGLAKEVMGETQTAPVAENEHAGCHGRPGCVLDIEGRCTKRTGDDIWRHLGAGDGCDHEELANADGQLSQPPFDGLPHRDRDRPGGGCARRRQGELAHEEGVTGTAPVDRRSHIAGDR
ncbi:hypothetical protein BH18ACT2_BH18ACT2_19150 [soil metagenome]